LAVPWAGEGGGCREAAKLVETGRVVGDGRGVEDGGGDSGSLVAQPNPTGSKTCITGTVDVMGTARHVGFATAHLFELVRG